MSTAQRANLANALAGAMREAYPGLEFDVQRAEDLCLYREDGFDGPDWVVTWTWDGTRCSDPFSPCNRPDDGTCWGLGPADAELVRAHNRAVAG